MLAPAPEKATVVWPARLLCEVKDVQDEMNILRSIVTQQKQILARINGMDKDVSRIYSAVHATLSLERNKTAINTIIYAFPDEIEVTMWRLLGKRGLLEKPSRKRKYDTEGLTRVIVEVRQREQRRKHEVIEGDAASVEEA
ncbi:hypothetical protein VUR80DRAFT_2083 [Thermomyces stellatus]